MKLVYLWIEEYKNIKKQGFTFAPEFEFSYDDSKKVLTINENKNYTSIFPSNISVTAIVGENGSGKSSILEHIENNIEKVTYYNKNKKFNQNDFVIDNNTDEKIRIIKYSSELEYQKKAENNFYIYFKSIMTRDNHFLNYLNKDFVFTHYYIYTSFTIIEINKELGEPTNKEELEDFLKFDLLNLLQTKLSITTMLGLEKKDYDVNHQKIDSCIIKLGEIYKNRNFARFIKIYNLIIRKAKKYELNTEGLDFFKVDSIDGFLDIFPYDEELNIFKTNNMSFGEIIDDELYRYFVKRHYIQEDYINHDNSQYNYQSLSSGEKQFINIFTHIAHKIQENENTKIILLDEPDTFLHPQWQKDFIKLLMKTLEKLNVTDTHIIFTTHSPFLLSDLPKENIIFLKDGKQTDVDIDTFGANIHTLLSHGFFMKDGFMGEFAKEKIDKAIKYLNQKKLSEDEIEYCENIISIIGEPILKRQLQKMLDSKKLNYITNDVQEEIELLKHRIEILSRRK